MVIEMLKRHESQGIDQFPSKLFREDSKIFRSEKHNFFSIWNREELSEERKGSINVHIYKKNDEAKCSNCRGMSLLPNTYKILSNIPLSRLTPYVEEINGDHQCGFRSDRSTTDHIFCIRQTREKKTGIH
jgi:hypothetical protein